SLAASVSSSMTWPSSQTRSFRLARCRYWLASLSGRCAMPASTASRSLGFWGVLREAPSGPFGDDRGEHQEEGQESPRALVSSRARSTGLRDTLVILVS